MSETVAEVEVDHHSTTQPLNHSTTQPLIGTKNQPIENMKSFSFCLVCLMLISVRAEEKSQRSDNLNLSGNESEDKSSEKRWTQDNRSFQPQPTFSKEFPSLNVQSEGETSKGQERAKQENTFKDFVGYEAIQSVLLNALKPKPIVDTAEESEKLAPNDGSQVKFLGDLVVRGSETLSRALNTVIDGPRKAITKLSAGATQALNQLGAYLIGL